MSEPGIIDVLRDQARLGNATNPLDPSASAAIIAYLDALQARVEAAEAERDRLKHTLEGIACFVPNHPAGEMARVALNGEDG